MSTAPPIVSYFLEHLFHHWRSLRVDIYLASFISVLLIEIASWRKARPHTHIASRSQSALHIDDLLVVLKFCLRSEDHEHELLVWVVRECLCVGTNFNEFFLVHE